MKRELSMQVLFYPSCSLNKKKIVLSYSNVPAVLIYYRNHLQPLFCLIMHEEYLYDDISLHFPYQAQRLANLE